MILFFKYTKHNNIITLILLVVIVFLMSCNNKEPEIKQKISAIDTSKSAIKKDTIPQQKISEFEQILIEAGLTNIQDIDSSLKVDLKYSTTDNFVGINMYGDIKNAYLQPDVAQKLANAQKYLKDTFPDYSLIIYDAVRPRSIQQMMWDSVKIPEHLKHKFLSKPKYGSLHNFGAAVDVSIIDENNKALDMGTPFDCSEKRAYPSLEKINLKKGIITQKQIDNRKLLRLVMDSAGFFNIQTEWWHFNSCYRKEARKLYAIIESHKRNKPEPLIAENNADNPETNISFKIQIKISMKPISLTSSFFKGLKINQYKHNKIYKYTTGRFKKLADAHKKLAEIRKMGFKDSFVAGFNNNERIGIKDAIELMQ